MTAIKPFFIIGPPKTGTTLLARLVDQHPSAACICEGFPWEPWRWDWDWGPDATVRQRYGSIFNPLSVKGKWHGFTKRQVRKWFRTFQRYEQDKSLRYLRQVSGRDYPLLAGFMECMPQAISTFAAHKGARLGGGKWPLYPYNLDFLFEAFGMDVKLVYTTRDPRAVWLSGKDFFEYDKRGNMTLNLLMEAEYRIDTIRNTAPGLLVIRYEDLLTKTSDVMKLVWGHLGLDYNASYLTYKPEQDRFPDRWSWVANATQEVDPSIADRWRGKLTKPEFDQITAIAREYCIKYDYPLALSGDVQPSTQPLRANSQQWVSWLKGKPMNAERDEALLRNECIALHDTLNITEKAAHVLAMGFGPKTTDEDDCPNRNPYFRGYTNGLIHGLQRGAFGFGHMYNLIHKYGMDR